MSLRLPGLIAAALLAGCSRHASADCSPACDPGYVCAAHTCAQACQTQDECGSDSLLCNGAFCEPCSPSAWYQDRDQDGFGDPKTSRLACAQPAGFVANSDDCDDSNRSVTVMPPWYRDQDQDTYGDPSVQRLACARPEGFVANAGDCSDSEPATHPGAGEAYDGRDNDCDGEVDESVDVGKPTEPEPEPAPVVGRTMIGGQSVDSPGSQWVRSMVSDQDIAYYLAHPTPEPAWLRRTKAFHAAGKRTALTLIYCSWLTATPPDGALNCSDLSGGSGLGKTIGPGIPSDPAQLQVELDLVAELLRRVGRYVDILFLDNEALINQRNYPRSQVTGFGAGPVPLIEWYKAVAKTIKSTRASLGLTTPRIGGIGLTPMAHCPADFHSSVCDWMETDPDVEFVDVHLHAIDLKEVSSRIAEARACTSKPLYAAEWSYYSDFRWSGSDLAAQPLDSTFRSAYSVPAAVATNGDYVAQAEQSTKVPIDQWNAFVETLGLSPTYFTDAWALMHAAGILGAETSLIGPSPVASPMAASTVPKTASNEYEANWRFLADFQELIPAAYSTTLLADGFESYAAMSRPEGWAALGAVEVSGERAAGGTQSLKLSSALPSATSQVGRGFEQHQRVAVDFQAFVSAGARLTVALNRASARRPILRLLEDGGIEAETSAGPQPLRDGTWKSWHDGWHRVRVVVDAFQETADVFFDGFRIGHSVPWASVGVVDHVDFETGDGGAAGAAFLDDVRIWFW